MKQYHFTKEGYEKLKKERETLLKERPDAVAHLRKSRELGDLSENGYYKASRMKVNSIDHRLFRLSVFLKFGKIIMPQKGGVIGLGSTVIISEGKREFTYMIVGSEEANPKEGKISDVSPLGKALLGKKISDEVTVNERSYMITTLK
jgi:transcription elongation factor GreA